MLEVLDLPGDPDRSAVVLLHEGLGSVRLWRDFPHALQAATGHRVVAYSRHGHGASDPPPRPRTPAFFHEEADVVLPALLADLGIADALLVGHSDGASIALVHAAGHDVRGVVAMAPHVFVEPMTLDAIRAVAATYQTELRARMARHHRDPDAAFHGWSDVWLDPAFEAWTLHDDVARIACPLLLLQGVDDQYASLAQLDAIESRAGGPVERLHLPCRHSPHLEAPEQTLAAVAAFVSDRGG